MRGSHLVVQVGCSPSGYLEEGLYPEQLIHVSIEVLLPVFGGIDLCLEVLPFQGHSAQGSLHNLEACHIQTVELSKRCQLESHTRDLDE